MDDFGGVVPSQTAERIFPFDHGDEAVLCGLPGTPLFVLVLVPEIRSLELVEMLRAEFPGTGSPMIFDGKDLEMFGFDFRHYA